MNVHDLTETLLKHRRKQGLSQHDAYAWVLGYMEGFADNLMARLKYENPDLYAEMMDNIKTRVEKYNG